MELLCRNYRAGRGEIDLVFRQDGTLCFVEVKTRHRQRMGSPIDAIDSRKRARLLATARQYLREIGSPRHLPCRFDAVEIIFEKSRLVDVRHWQAIFPIPLDID